jgi:deoxyguanosine kinase
MKGDISMKKHVYVAIEGPIGVGKTTLARLVHEEFGWRLLLEVFEENPFLAQFYEDRERYAFPTQIFFLLSRYRQQHDVIPDALKEDSLVSDYLFDKDQLFARLNLKDKELRVYNLVHDALAEQIPTPNLVVYLRASTDTLMERIAFRDRPYERSMSREYIDQLRQAYERFFQEYDAAPVMEVDTEDLNFVSSQEDRRWVLTNIESRLEQGVVQLPLIERERKAEAEVREPLVEFARLTAAIGKIAESLASTPADYGSARDRAAVAEQRLRTLLESLEQ